MKILYTRFLSSSYFSNPKPSHLQSDAVPLHHYVLKQKTKENNVSIKNKSLRSIVHLCFAYKQCHISYSDHHPMLIYVITVKHYEEKQMWYENFIESFIKEIGLNTVVVIICFLYGCLLIYFYLL